MIILNIFSWCAECSWWLLPLLLGAWLLGYLLYSWTRGRKYRSEIDGLHGNIRNWKSKFNENNTLLSEANYEKERLSGEYATLKSRFADYDTKYHTLEKKYNNAIATGGGDVDVSEWTDKIADLENQLEVSRNTNLKLQGDYSELKNNFNDLQEKVQTEVPSHGIVGNQEEQVRITGLEKQLADAQAELNESKAQVAHLNANYNSLQTDMDALVAQTQKTQQSGGGAEEDSENLKARISDLEKKLAIAYENNTKMEADYAHLKADYGDLEIKTQKPVEDSTGEITGLQQRISELELLLASRSTEDDSAPGEGKRKKKKKKKKRKNKKDGEDGKKKKKKKNKKKGKKKKDKKGKQGSGGKKLDYRVAFGEENLQIVEGIGPKIEGVLQEAGISNWLTLANAKEEQLNEILQNAGPRYKMHDPSTWSEQAAMAYDGDWRKLVNFQKNLGGIVNAETEAKVEKMYVKAMGFKMYKIDDLKVVEGIGPKIEELLKNAGINTWEKLADSKVEAIQKVLDEAGPRYKLANPSTWAKQSKLAAKGDWHALKIYQDALKGGKE